MIIIGEEGFSLEDDGSYPHQLGEVGDFNATCTDPSVVLLRLSLVSHELGH
jgi:hypothetical protein